MGMNRQQLNQKQVEVLRWIGDGYPSDVYTDGYEHRIIDPTHAQQRVRR